MPGCHFAIRLSPVQAPKPGGSIRHHCNLSWAAFHDKNEHMGNCFFVASASFSTLENWANFDHFQCDVLLDEVVTPVRFYGARRLLSAQTNIYLGDRSSPHKVSNFRNLCRLDRPARRMLNFEQEKHCRHRKSTRVCWKHLNEYRNVLDGVEVRLRQLSFRA